VTITIKVAAGADPRDAVRACLDLVSSAHVLDVRPAAQAATTWPVHVGGRCVATLVIRAGDTDDRRPCECADPGCLAHEGRQGCDQRADTVDEDDVARCYGCAL